MSGGLAAGETVTSLSATPTGRGYWIFTTRGRVVPFGDAASYGDMAERDAQRARPRLHPDAVGPGLLHGGQRRRHLRLRRRPLPRVHGRHERSTPRCSRWCPTATGSATGWSPPTAASSPSTPRSGARWAAQPLNKPVTGMVRFGDGYLMVGEDGGIFNFSSQAVRRLPRRQPAGPPGRLGGRSVEPTPQAATGARRSRPRSGVCGAGSVHVRPHLRPAAALP